MSRPTFDLPTAPETRDFRGWYLLTVIFTVVIAFQLYGSLNRKPNENAKFAPLIMKLENIVSMRLLNERLEAASQTKASPSSTKTLAESLDEDINDLVEPRKTNPMAARLYAAMRTEQGKKIEPIDVAILAQSSDKEHQALAKIYTEPNLTPERAKALAGEIKSTGFLKTIAEVHARERAGEKNVRAELLSIWRGVMFLVAATAACIGIVGGMVIWTVYFTLRAQRKLTPLGLPMGNISLADADRLALRAGEILLFYVVGIQILGSSIGAFVSQTVATWINGFLILGFVILTFRIPVNGKGIDLRSLGYSREKLGSHIVWGVLGCLANLPLVLLMGVIGTTVFSGLPPAEHPVSTQLQQGTNLPFLIAILFFGAFVAPFWEEFVFRGLFFPALNRATGALVGSIVVSSFVFAAIHPTGIPAWPALATVAAMSCVLAYHTRSIVPSIVMHMLHNFLLLILNSVLFS